MKIKAVNGFARTLKSEGVPWVSCYPTSPVNNALGEEGVPILMMGEERFAVAVADGFSRVTCGKQIGVCTVMAGLNAAGIQMAYGAVAQAWEDSSPLLVIAEGVDPGATRHTHYDIGQAFKSVTKWRGEIDRAELPLLTTLKAKGAFPENHPVSVGVRGSMAEHFLRKCDVLISIGASLFPNRFSHTIPDAEKKTIVQCTIDTLDINRSYETRCAVIGDARLTLQALGEELGKRTGGGRKNPVLLEEIRAARQEFMAKFRPWLESNEMPINPYRVLGDLMKVLDPKQSFVTADSGNTRDQTSTVYETHIPRGFLGWGNVST